MNYWQLKALLAQCAPREERRERPAAPPKVRYVMPETYSARVVKEIMRQYQVDMLKVVLKSKGTATLDQVVEATGWDELQALAVGNSLIAEGKLSYDELGGRIFRLVVKGD